MQPCAFANLLSGGLVILIATHAGCAGDAGEPPAKTADDTSVTVTDPTEPSTDELPSEDELDDVDLDAPEPEAEASDTAEAAPGAGPSDRDPKNIQAVIKENRQPVRDCYEKALKKIPGLQGDMVIRFVIAPDGKVKQAELNVERSTLRSPEAVDCAIDVLRDIQFSEHPKGMESTVNYPFNFKP